ncbi:thiol-disulfide isomerase/thioredoxin [Lutibacter sp. Hel_I_33_5]|uniref:TlpA family protein disulfide reductase n=1 Tax=Lutibacter sp. Hel_I_33_5 TaxID=1566289 RepID=UPI0011AA2331|nr:TlpA disulfide reductase family protein [Lutibacter sp. Hel_I_33_5]TVZ57153.1 thiol-disulfide isomerase/thioredoxin [Lutibacter sp. Hel_I_33_5]
MKKILLLLLVVFASCETPTQFSDIALQDTVVTLQDETVTFIEVLHKYKGKKILIDVWASWCGDCIKSLPRTKELQQEFPEAVFLFLSVDKNNKAWKNGIKRFRISGEHYNLPKGMKKGDLVDFLGLRWIPRYLVINENGFVDLFKATKASDSNIVEALKK